MIKLNWTTNIGDPHLSNYSQDGRPPPEGMGNFATSYTNVVPLKANLKTPTNETALQENGELSSSFLALHLPPTITRLPRGALHLYLHRC